LKINSLISTISSRFPENNKFFKALILGTISAITNQGLNFITIILITRQLGDVTMGHFSLVQSMVTMFFTIGILGQNVSGTALTSRFKKRYPDQLGLVIGNSYILSAIMVVFIGLIIFISSSYFFKDVQINSSSASLSHFIIILWFVGMTFDMLQVSILIGLEAYRDLIKTDFLKGLFSIIVILPLAIKIGLFGAIIGYAISSFIGILLNQWFIRKNMRSVNNTIIYQFNFDIIKKILGMSLPVFIAALFISITTWATNKLVFNGINGPAALGIVFVCRQILILLQFIPVQISKVLLPFIAEDRNTIEEYKVKKISLRLSIGICIFFAIAGLIFENTVLNLYNLDPKLALFPYRIILLTVLFSAMNMILGQFAIAGKNPWLRTYADIVISLIMVTVTLILIKINIFITLPVAILLSFIASNIFLIYYVGTDFFQFNFLKSKNRG
jgi:O-antigen/teichoic acid export membrane protein